MKRGLAPWEITALDSKVHDRAAFSCGAPELDRYIREHASQDVKRDVARVFVAVQAGAPTLCGYYRLSAASFQRASLPANQARSDERRDGRNVVIKGSSRGAQSH